MEGETKADYRQYCVINHQ